MMNKRVAKPGAGKKIIIVTNQVPGYDVGLQASGHARYLKGFFEYFRGNGFDVSLIVLRPNVDFVWQPATAFQFNLIGPAFRAFAGGFMIRSPLAVARQLGWKMYVRLPRLAQVAVDRLRLALRKARGHAHTLGRVPSQNEIAYVQAVAADLQPDVVIYDGVFNSCGRLNNSQHWVITHEVKYQRAASFAAQGVSVLPATFDAQTERALLEESGNIIAIQWDDAKEFARLTPDSRVVVVPVTMSLPHTIGRSTPHIGRCLFVGSGSYHNYDGLRWFIDDCWPKIRAAMPTATLDVVGSVCFRLSSASPGVRFHGVVKDLAALYSSASVTVVPLRIGSGLKVKLVEALAHGQAIVTTAVGAQGLREFAPEPFIVADTSRQFAEQTVALLASPSRQRSLRAAATQCARAFAPDIAFSEFDAALLGKLALA